MTGAGSARTAKYGAQRLFVPARAEAFDDDVDGDWGRGAKDDASGAQHTSRDMAHPEVDATTKPPTIAGQIGDTCANEEFCTKATDKRVRPFFLRFLC